MKNVYLIVFLAALFLSSPVQAQEEDAIVAPDVSAEKQEVKQEEQEDLTPGKPIDMSLLVLPAVKPSLKTVYGEMKVYIAKYEDTLLDIARRFNLGFVDVQAANPDLDPWIPGEGAKVILPKQHILPDTDHTGVVVNVGDMRLYQFDRSGNVLKTFPIGVGREGMMTPMGTTTVVRKAEGPWWYPTPRMRQEDQTLPPVVKQGPQNPLGTHSLYLGWPTFAIHGTNEPWGIGRRVSSGCVRMYPEDIPQLFETVDVGTKVTTVSEFYKAARFPDGEFYLEAHPSKAQSTAIEYQEPKPFDLPNGFIQWLNQKAGSQKEDINWVRVRQVMLERRGYPVQITNIKDMKVVSAPVSSGSSSTGGTTSRGLKPRNMPLPYN